MMQILADPDPQHWYEISVSDPGWRKIRIWYRENLDRGWGKSGSRSATLVIGYHTL
jgi:hypothetical protein